MNEVKQVYADLKRSQADVEDTMDAVRFRRESFRIDRLEYQQQVATYVEVLDAQRRLFLYLRLTITYPQPLTRSIRLHWNVKWES